MGFGTIWEGFWTGFGTALGELWTLLGHFKPIFWFQDTSILENNFVSQFSRLLDSILGRFGRVREGSGEDLGRFWEGFGEVSDSKNQHFGR